MPVTQVEVVRADAWRKMPGHARAEADEPGADLESQAIADQGFVVEAKKRTALA